MSFQYFLHVDVRLTFAGEDDDFSGQRLNGVLKEIWEWIREQPFGRLSSDRGARLDLTFVNGESVLVGFGNPNKPGSEPSYPTMLRQLLDLVAAKAPGSFGFAYYINHDADRDWTLLVIKRGQVAPEIDPWFSPMIPTVEDPYPSDDIDAS